MTSKPDWSRAAEMSPEELDRALQDDLDEMDDNPELTPAELAAMSPGSDAFTPDQLASLVRRRA